VTAIHALPRIGAGAAAAGVLAIGSAALLAQSKPFRSSIDTVEVHVTVRASDGTLARGLTKDDFEILDNGRRQEIAVFSAVVQPITMTLLLDRSGSVGAQFPQVTAAARAFIERLLPADRAAISTLTWDCEPLTSDRERLFTRLDSLAIMDAASAVWGGLNRSLSTLGRESGRRAVLLFSDGADMPSPVGLKLPPRDGCLWAADTSLVTLDDVVRRAEREGVMVYTVSIENRSGTTRDGDLRRIARESGGERYRLEREAELAVAFTSIADELHHQYLLGFVPEAFDNKRHDLDVRVKRPGLSARARRSYVASRTTVPPGTDVPPSMPLTDTEVEGAIKAGSAGDRRQAECVASILVPDNAAETEALITIVAEGPAGRVMRRAREARQARRSFTIADVTTVDRAPSVEITATVGTRVTVPPPAGVDDPVTAAPPKPPPVLSPLTALRVRSREMIGATLEPVDQPAPSPGARPFIPPPSSRTRISARFDLAAFRALPGDVEVLVQSRVIRRCAISAKDKAAIR
jgi:Ca-activated chloride channel family protein